MGETEKIVPEQVAEETGVDEEDVQKTLRWLVNNGWIFSNHIQFNS